MTDESIAETLDNLDQPGTEDQDVETVESAPTEDNAPKEDGFQKRINKVTADKYAEKRRADELERQLNELRSKKETVTHDAPKPDDFDFDDDKYQQALIDHKVNLAIQSREEAKAQEQAKAKALEAQSTFNERIESLGKPDFAEVANQVPLLPQGVADALMQSESGPELIYHLGTHLDMADRIANMSPQTAMMELGKLSATLNSKPAVKLSNAPAPIEPLTSGGSIPKERGPDGATFV